MGGFNFKEPKRLQTLSALVNGLTEEMCIRDSYTGTVYNLVQHSSYMNLTFIVNERKQRLILLECRVELSVNVFTRLHISVPAV